MAIDDRTKKALGNGIMEKLQNLVFCIVGCGGTGANFAEMLIRSGAKKLTLIDGDFVDDSNLNRVFSYSATDIDMPKVEALKNRLEIVRPDLHIRTFCDSFRTPENISEGYEIGQQVRDAVHDADVVFVGTDTGTSRIAVESLCREKIGGMYLSCGVLVDRKSGRYAFECNWSPQTPAQHKDAEGYGPEGASFASIIQEATSVAFTMLLSHLVSAQSDFRSYVKEYDANFAPVEVLINEKPSGKIQLF